LSSASPAMEYVPEPPYIASGALGGPSVVYLVTPMRNALTLGAMDATKSAATLYKDVFSQGFRGGWSGGAYMASAALPGFLAIGPMFHFYKGVSGDSNAAAVALTAATESMIFYGSETKNAQTAFNQDAQKRGAQVIGRVQSQFNPLGGGLGFHVARNYLAMSGLRVLSGPCQGMLEKTVPSISEKPRVILSDFIANVFVSALSAPLHQLYGWSVTNRIAVAGTSQGSLVKDAVHFLKLQYLTPEGRISSVAGRDIMLRIAYNATIFTLYGSIERSFVAYWPTGWSWNR